MVDVELQRCDYEFTKTTRERGSVFSFFFLFRDQFQAGYHGDGVLRAVRRLVSLR